MAQRDDDVTGTQSAGRRGRIGRHRINPGAGFVQEIEVTHDAPRQREILSADPEIGAPDLAVYSATKGALATLTKNAANAHRFDRIRVNGINVGWTDTPAERVMQAETLGRGPGWLDAANAAQPFGRLLSVNDIANLAILLLSDAAGPMTGALIDQEQWVIGANR